MSEVFVIGISHHTAPLEVRERLAIPEQAIASELHQLTQDAPIDEAMLISTCNRVELYAASTAPAKAMIHARDWMSEKLGSDHQTGMFYTHQGNNAVRHAFRVASSLDSLVIGEPQILGQVKQAYALAENAGTVGALLGRCFTRAFSVAKRVRNETSIAEGTVSVSSIACELAEKIVGKLNGRRVLLIGAGEMGEASARYLQQTGARLHVVNRSEDKAIALAKSSGGRAIAYEQLFIELSQADVVIASTSSPRFLLNADNMKDVVRARRRRPLFIIDIAVPRDVDPRASRLDNVFVYDVDDLQQVAEGNMASRSREVQQAERIIQKEVLEFEQWRRTLQLTPTIVALREHFLDTVESELKRSLPELSDDAIKRLTQNTVNKLLHGPITELKSGGQGPDGPVLIETIKRIFKIRGKKQELAVEQALHKAAISTPSGDKS